MYTSFNVLVAVALSASLAISTPLPLPKPDMQLGGLVGLLSLITNSASNANNANSGPKSPSMGFTNNVATLGKPGDVAPPDAKPEEPPSTFKKDPTCARGKAVTTWGHVYDACDVGIWSMIRCAPGAIDWMGIPFVPKSDGRWAYDAFWDAQAALGYSCGPNQTNYMGNTWQTMCVKIMANFPNPPTMETIGCVKNSTDTSVNTQAAPTQGTI
ncbi:hypothetical protein HDU96_010865 [Phlyctochytrium bullatum]|nr:hypothetical protein HDU96_010865 [Phlyctochytrium bullatum]